MTYAGPFTVNGPSWGCSNVAYVYTLLKHFKIMYFMNINSIIKSLHLVTYVFIRNNPFK